jgi:hypothetical protein
MLTASATSVSRAGFTGAAPTPTGRFLQPRWPSQLEELRTMIDTAGIEGLSFEYWSPPRSGRPTAPTPALRGDGRARNRLRPFAPGFAEDPDYKGDQARFLADFAQAVVTDIKTLSAAGLRTSMFGLQNEPYVNHTIYPTCEYPNPEAYIPSFKAVASAIRAHDPSIMIFADTYHGFPKLIAPACPTPRSPSSSTAYVVHTVGWPSERVLPVHKEITEKLPPRPWFQNEYEYLTGGATADRCLNTVEHIMNSFQLAANPTWFWLHALKPIGNAEASGYCLGFWQSQIAPIKDIPSEKKRRWIGGPEFTSVPEQLRDLEIVSAKRGDPKRAGLQYNFIVNQPVTVYLAVENHGETKLEAAWEPTDLTLAWDGGTDRVLNAASAAAPSPSPPTAARPADATARPTSPSSKPKSPPPSTSRSA